MEEGVEKNYNDEPVCFCIRCLSLKIVNMNFGERGDDPTKNCYCYDCGSTYIKQASIDQWSDLYETKYHKKYIKDGRRKSKTTDI